MASLKAILSVFKEQYCLLTYPHIHSSKKKEKEAKRKKPLLLLHQIRETIRFFACFLGVILYNIIKKGEIIYEEARFESM